jgi:glucan phosphoethanolaminetransferase (alkaline phosphatase superfamily)
MDDKFLKYSKLYILIFLLFLAVPVILGLLVITFWGFSKLVSSSPVDIALELLMISLMPAIFASAYVVFFRRTRQHPSPGISTISKILFVIGIVCCAAVLVTDIISFSNKRNLDISAYHCFSLAFLAGNMGGLFFIAIIQAFTTKKEVDWMERNR